MPKPSTARQIAIAGLDVLIDKVDKSMNLTRARKSDLIEAIQFAINDLRKNIMTLEEAMDRHPEVTDAADFLMR